MSFLIASQISDVDSARLLNIVFANNYVSEAEFVSQSAVDEVGGKLANEQDRRQNSLGNGKFSVQFR
jgi:hypothetical protein